jgi:hypothetical protein
MEVKAGYNNQDLAGEQCNHCYGKSTGFAVSWDNRMKVSDLGPGKETSRKRVLNHDAI